MHSLHIVLGHCLLLAAPMLARAAEDDAFRKINGAALVFEGTLEMAVAGPVAFSLPPIYSFTLTFSEINDPLRGKRPAAGVFGYRYRGEKPPQWQNGLRYLVAARPAEQGAPPMITVIQPATPESLQLARRAVQVPLGWSFDGDRPVSPWAARGTTWPESSKLSSEIVCAKTKRPALLAGKGISLTVEQVPPQNLKKYQNPFGDGWFKVTVTNANDTKVQIPALIQDGQVRWADSLVLLCQDKSLVLPRLQPLANPRPVELGPGESISGVIDTMLLGDAVQWPRGGSRVYFTFCLGEVAAENFFYYYSSLHDTMRAERLRQLRQ